MVSFYINLCILWPISYPSQKVVYFILLKENIKVNLYTNSFILIIIYFELICFPRSDQDVNDRKTVVYHTWKIIIFVVACDSCYDSGDSSNIILLQETYG